MTTYQDQPLSRRQIREREAEAARAAEAGSAPPVNPDAGEQPRTAEPVAPEPLNYEPSNPEPLNPEPLNYVTQGRTPLPQYDAPVAPTTPPAAADEADAGFRYRDFSPEGRRAARLNWPPAQEPGDLDYRTQGRPEQQAVPSAPPVLPAETPSEPPAAAASAHPEGTHPEGTHPEGTHPEGTLSRRELRALREAQDRENGIVPVVDQPYGEQAEAPVAEQPVAQPPVAASSQAPVFDTSASDAPVSDAPVFAAPPSLTTPPAPPPLVEPAEPQTDAVASLEALFRAQSGAIPVAQPEPVATPEPFVAPIPPIASAPPVAAEPPRPPLWGPTTPPTIEEPVAEAPAFEAPAFEAPVFEEPVFEEPVFEELVVDEPAPEAPLPSAQPVLPPWGGLTPGQSPDAAFAPPVLPVAPPPFVPEAAAPPLQPAPPVVEPVADPFLAPPAAFVPTPPAPVTDASVADAPATDSQPPVPGERPRNHWSRQAELDDEAQPPTGSLSRDVGGGPATANALVLNEIPNTDIIMSSVTSTGDVLVTGSISLPASLSSTGALPAQLDDDDLDNLLDPGDHQVASTDSQPVRAIRAVSTHTSSREIIGTITPKRSNRALTALIIAAAGMAAVVVTLLVVALASGVLG